MQKRVTVFAVHARHPLAKLSRCRYPDVGLRTAVHAACLGHEVSLIVFRGSQPLEVPTGDTVGDQPYIEARQCVDTVNQYRQAAATHQGDDEEDGAGASGGRSGDAASDALLQPLRGLVQAPPSAQGSLSIEFVAPPRVEHLNSKQHQNWALAIMAALPPSSDCIIDSCGPDLLNVSHMDGHRRAQAYAQATLSLSERQDHLSELAEADQWTQGRTEFPTIQSLLSTIAQHVQAVTALSTFLLHETERHDHAVLEARRARDDRRRDLDANLGDAPVKTWLLNDWRALDVSPLQRIPIVTIRGFNGSGVEGSLSSSAGAGIQHYVKRAWATAEGLADWSMLCVPPLLNASNDVDLGSINSPESLIEATRAVRGFRITTSEAAVDPMPLAGAMPPRLLAHAVASKVFRSRPSLDDVAHFLTQNMVTNKYGLGESLSNAEILRRAAGSAPVSPDEVGQAKQDQARKDRFATVFPTLEGLSSNRFVRRRVGLARSPVEPLRVDAASVRHLAELRREIALLGSDTL